MNQCFVSLEMLRILLLYFLNFTLVLTNTDGSGFAYKGSCGQPGTPAYGELESPGKEVYQPGDIIKYRCKKGYILFGEDSRGCLENGTWSSSQPICRENIALGEPTLQSATLWSYEPGLAVDDNVDTCSFTPRTTDQRWWQVHLGEATNIEYVAVSISPGSYQHFTIFVIELLEGNKALYKPCSKFDGQYETLRAVFLCNDGLGHTGQFVYIRDDREEQEYFGLCEVQVFPLKNSTECGSPEIPVGAEVEEFEENYTYRCLDGYLLSGPPSVECGSDGKWIGSPPVCLEVECKDPLSPKNGYIEVSNFKGRYQFGSVATYKCNPGFILWGNASRVCSSEGIWDGETPLCHPITCGQPPQIESGSFELINGSTTWQSLAYYACSTGYTNSIIDDGGHVFSECTLEGTWTKPNINCYFDPIAAANNLKKGRALGDWTEEQGTQINIGTLAAIGVLSSLIVLSLIIVIIIVTHRRSQNQANSRKISQNSANHLITDTLRKGDDDDFKDNDSGSGVIVYDDLNQPHLVEPEPQEQHFPFKEQLNNTSLDFKSSLELRNDVLDPKHDSIMAKYNVQNTLYHHTSLSTFTRNGSPKESGHSKLYKQDKSPVSERSSGDGGSDKEGHYASMTGKGGYIIEEDQDPDEHPYSTLTSRRTEEYSLRIPDGEDPYASVGGVREEYNDESNYETVEQNYEIIRKYKETDRSVSSGTSSASQATVLHAGSDQDVQALYARVDMSKKQKNRNSDSSLSPGSDFSPGDGINDTKSLITESRFHINDPRSLINDTRSLVIENRFQINDSSASLQNPRSLINDTRSYINDSRNRVTDTTPRIPDTTPTNSDMSPTKLLINKFNNITDVSPDVGPVKPLKHSASDERIPSYSKPYLESGSFTLNKPRPRGANPGGIRGTQGPPLSLRGSQVAPNTGTENPNANMPKPLPRTVHSFAKSQSLFSEPSLKPSKVHQMVSSNPFLRSDENEIERVGLPGTSILKRNCDRNGWQTANI